MIVESTKQLEYFLKHATNSDIILIPIFKDPNKHPANNSVSLMYVNVLDFNEEFMLVFDHGEKDHDAYSIDILDKLNGDQRKFTFDKKVLSHTYDFNKVFDINLMYYFATSESLDFELYETNAHTFFGRKYYERDDVNNIIPIMKHLEYCTSLVYDGKRIINKSQKLLTDDTYLMYNITVLDNLYKIEKSGLYIDSSQFNTFFATKNAAHNPSSNYLYTNYNIYTAAGRPSNSFGGINFAALHKDNGERGIIQSRYDTGILVEFDYDAFHIRLIADLVDYKFPDNISVHEYLGKQYFDKDKLTPEEYQDSKNLTFQLLYGGISKEFKQIPFFKLVDDYIYNIWNDFKVNGYVKSKLFGRIIENIDGTFSKNKMFNYYLQNYETEFNLIVLDKIHAILPGMTGNIILYTYDSMLFDIPLEGAKKFVTTIQTIMNKDNKFPVKIKYGTNYHDMKRLKV